MNAELLDDYPRQRDLPCAWGGPLGCGDFKTVPADFVVTEQLALDFSGDGEHLWLYVEATDMNTDFVIKQLAKYFAVPRKVIGYSGKKDRRAVSRQWFSVQLPGKAAAYLEVDLNAALSAQISDITVLDRALHNRKLRVGTHKTNHFAVRLRHLKAWQSEPFQARLDGIIAQGFPNYFGPQRFGRHEGNIELALQALMSKQREKITRQPRKLDRKQREWVLSTLRGLDFNRCLAGREQQGTAHQYVPDDIVQLMGSSSFFRPEQWDAALQQRLDEGDIGLAGILPGVGDLSLPGYEPDATLLAYLCQQKVVQGVRPFRVRPLGLTWSCVGVGDDLALEMAFSLPKGSYATCLLRELIHLQEAVS